MRAQFLALVALAGSAQPLPARFESDRVFVFPVSSSGVQLRLYTDTGGGTLLSRTAAVRLRVPISSPPPAMSQAIGKGGGITAWPRFAPGRGIPKPHVDAIPVVPNVRELPGWPEQGDGILGAAWFAGRIWTWDYPRRRFSLESSTWRPQSAARCVRLGFKTSATSARVANFPRIDVAVAGRRLPLLLDTGAETYLSDPALSQLHDGGPRMRATSMISASVFSAWHRAHPDWPLIDDAQVGTHAAMIRVADVDIAGLHSGPVWFTHRSDASYHSFMSSMMDRRVEGSLGGNALRRFVMTVDYVGARACFR